MLPTRLGARIVLLLLGCLLVPGASQAYLDPGSGSYVLQILVASLVAGLFAIKLFWLRLTGFFGKLFGRRTPHKPGDE